ncbi:MAG: sigma-54-dependent Fis family transcriptional regulator [Deltaproteobacteria bacterium]|jgi:two-component system NtrC family response regulator|nr:sigma-54-dependent Fis family transcriptional regulator [Deltaproteobacteria bacterium]
MHRSHILIIDDEAVVCDGCRAVLSEKYAVDACMTGKEGLDAFLKGRYDLALLDMKLPDTDGMEVLRIIRQDKSAAYVIVMTGYSTVKNAVQAMKSGAFDYLAKPFTDDELLLAVDKALEHKRLKEENLALRNQLFEQFDFSNIIGEDPALLQVFDEIRRVAPTDSTVLLQGESGTGKELFARAIHTRSPRAARRFVALDCSCLAPSVMESELFGHVKGAFTGAIQDKAGIFEVANEGTLFLDEISNLTLEVQGKLLRVMDTHEYKPVGASRFKKTDIRIIAATNRDLKIMVAENAFRQDLFYRLNVFPVYLPPLRERKDDIPRLAYHFLRFFCRKTGKKIEGFSDDALQVLVNQPWPGNVRQLKNVVERLVIMADQRLLDGPQLLAHLHPRRSNGGNNVIPETIEELKAVKKHMLDVRYGELEKAFLVKALKASDGNITRAAERVGIKRPNFHALMKKHDLSIKDLGHVSPPAAHES